MSRRLAFFVLTVIAVCFCAEATNVPKEAVEWSGTREKSVQPGNSWRHHMHPMESPWSFGEVDQIPLNVQRGREKIILTEVCKNSGKAGVNVKECLNCFRTIIKSWRRSLPTATVLLQKITACTEQHLSPIYKVSCMNHTGNSVDNGNGTGPKRTLKDSREGTSEKTDVDMWMKVTDLQMCLLTTFQTMQLASCVKKHEFLCKNTAGGKSSLQNPLDLSNRFRMTMECVERKSQKTMDAICNSEMTTFLPMCNGDMFPEYPNNEFPGEMPSFPTSTGGFPRPFPGNFPDIDTSLFPDENPENYPEYPFEYPDNFPDYTFTG